MGYKYEAKVTVDYYFDVEAESEAEANEYAYYNFSDYAYTSEIYDVQLDEIGHSDDCECDECVEEEEED